MASSKAAANQFAANILPVIREIQAGGAKSANASALNRDSPYEPRTGANFCAFPAFRQDRLAARMTAVTAGVPNGGRGADLAIFTGIGAHSSHRLLLNA